MKIGLFAAALFWSASLVCAATRTAPADPLLLKSSDLTVTFDRADGLPFRFETVSGRLWGEDAGHKMGAVLCRLQPRSYKTIELSAASAAVKQQSADFLFNAVYDGALAASFHVVYQVSGSSLTVTLQSVTERNGFELIEVSLPNLVTVREEDGPAWLAHGRNGGALVNLKDATAHHIADDQFFGRISSILPVALVGTGRVECAMEVTAVMDGTETEVTGEPGHRHALIGTVQTYRVHGGREYDMNDGGAKIRGNQNTPNLLVGQTPRCRLDFIGDTDGNGTVDWLDGAKLIRKRMPPIPTHYFDDKFLYLIYGRYKPDPAPRTTFAQSEKLVHDVAMLTDNAPQVAFVSGWVYDGQDTGFPCEDKVNESMGGANGLRHLMQQGPKYNANITVNVNYDDAYRSCPSLKNDVLARRPDGEIWRSRDWAGETSYIMGLAKYMAGPGVRRVQEMIERYGIHDAMLIDALSWFAIRNDWDAAHPASGYKNLIDGRFKIIDEFNKRGVHVVSEMLRYPMVGEMAESANGPAGGDDPFGGEAIPLVPLIYRRSIIWGNAGGDPKHSDRNLFWNARPIYWYGNDTNRTEITDYYYLSVLPWMKVHARDIESFRHTGYRSEIGLGDRSKITMNWIDGRYSVVVDGIAIAANDATFCPIDKDRVAFYSRDAKTLIAELPAGWTHGELAGRALYSDRRETVAVHSKDGKIEVAVPAGRPVIVYRNAALADRFGQHQDAFR